MNGTTHVRIALAAGLYAAIALESEPVPMMSMVAGAFIAARLPDVDQQIGLPHRGLTHSVLLTALLAFGAVYFLPRPLALGFMVGYIMHVVADMFTIQGVELLWPVRWRMKVPFLSVVRTGGLLEALLSILVLCGIILMLWQLGLQKFEFTTLRSFLTW